MSGKKQGGFNANQLKIIAILAMTADHLVSVIFPNYPKDWWILGIHILGRLTAPIMWFFIAEGYFYTKNLKKYAGRLFFFALISHFAYNFAFGIPFLPFQTSFFNQTSVIWSLAWGLIALAVSENPRLKNWCKTLILLGICLITFCSDWSCIAAMAVTFIGVNRGNFSRQMAQIVIWTFFYAVVYFIFIDKVYALLQMGTCLAIPLLRCYDGERGRWKGMGKLFYLYYPLHLAVCGVIRILLWGVGSVTAAGLF